MSIHAATAGIILLLFALPLYAQAPNRSDFVAQLVTTKYAGQLTGNEDTRRTVLRGLCQDLNAPAIDNGNWGLLTKTDQGGKVPSDILVWATTREHFDVLTDFGPAWIPDGPLQNPQWIWTACGAVTPAPSPLPPVPSPQPNPGYDLDVIQRLMRLENNQLIAGLKLDAIQATGTDTNTKVSELNSTAGAIGKFIVQWVVPPLTAALATWQITKD